MTRFGPGVETEDRDGDFATLQIEITPPFQIRSGVADLDRARSRPGLWPNHELGELEASDITDAGVYETDKWRWTVEHLYVPNHLRGLGCNGEHAQEREQGSNQSCVHAAIFVGAHEESQSDSAMMCGALLRERLVSAKRLTAIFKWQIQLALPSTRDKNVGRALLFLSFTRFQLRDSSSSKLRHKTWSFLC
jgi:hypothetical protein